MGYRVGIGYDIHRFAKDRKLFLGGVRIPYKTGLLGHSDADVILHAICDALLGAAALGDIGKIFPNTDRRYKGISSLKLLAAVRELLCKNCFKIVNVDTMAVLEAPKLGAYKDKMRKNISKALKIPIGNISIKATTNEGVGHIGKNEAAAAYAVALISG